MKNLTSLLILLSTFLFSCSESITQENEPQQTDSENIASQEVLKVEFPGIDFSILSALNENELRITRNSLFAKYGKVFQSEDLQNHFKKQDWYNENNDFSRELMSEADKSTIELITYLEKNENILWKVNSDMDGDSIEELCLFVEKNDHSRAYLFVNSKKVEILNNWKEENIMWDDQSISPYWTNLSAKIVDINKSDNNKEVIVTQRHYDIEDPGYENTVVTKHDEITKFYTLGSNSYDSGQLKISENKMILNVSNCPEHTQEYSVVAGELEMVSENISEMPEYGCAACFIGSSMVDLGDGKQKRISELTAGDEILAYDSKTNERFKTLVEEVISVQHSSMVELIFGHDTITSTLDHPFYLKEKGWCSINPSVTNFNYSNYNSTGTIEVGDAFVNSTGKTLMLLEVRYIEAPQKTYTITRLQRGDAFYINDILVGVEKIRNPL